MSQCSDVLLCLRCSPPRALQRGRLHSVLRENCGGTVGVIGPQMWSILSGVSVDAVAPSLTWWSARSQRPGPPTHPKVGSELDGGDPGSSSEQGQRGSGRRGERDARRSRQRPARPAPRVMSRAARAAMSTDVAGPGGSHSWCNREFISTGEMPRHRSSVATAVTATGGVAAAYRESVSRHSLMASRRQRYMLKHRLCSLSRPRHREAARRRAERAAKTTGATWR